MDTDTTLRKVFEDVTTGNVKAVLAHSNETRKQVVEIRGIVDRLGEELRNRDEVIAQLRHQLASVQAAVYAKGT